MSLPIYIGSRRGHIWRLGDSEHDIDDSAICYDTRILTRSSFMNNNHRAHTQFHCFFVRSVNYLIIPLREFFYTRASKRWLPFKKLGSLRNVAFLYFIRARGGETMFGFSRKAVGG